MKRTIKVFVGDEARGVGTLHYDAVGSRERSAFAYAETWLGSADRFALEPALPLVAGPQFHRKLQTVRFFMGHLLTRSLMVGPGGSSCATMPGAARQPAGRVKNRRPFNSRQSTSCSQRTMPAVSARCVFRTRRGCFAVRQKPAAAQLLRSSN